MENVLTQCTKCQEPLPDDGKNRKRRRERQCRGCLNRSVNERRRNNPLRHLQHRFKNNARSWWPKQSVAHLTRMASVRAVVERCQSQCVLTGEANMDALSIVPQRAPNKESVPASCEELVLVCKRSARELKSMSPTMREACFNK